MGLRMRKKDRLDYYTILGLQSNANIEEIHKAYRTLAKKYHPDIQSGDEENFKLLAQAYHVLRDQKERERYDRTIEAPRKGYIGSAPETMFNEQFSAYFLGVFFVYAGIITSSFFILDFVQFIYFSVSVSVFTIIFFIILGKIIKGDNWEE